MTEIPVVNEKDKIIGFKESKKVNKKEIYRVSGLWITNKKNQILLAQRTLTRKEPYKWSPAVAGTVEKNENYFSNIKKEAFEELGLKKISIKKEKKIRIKGKWNFFLQMFSSQINLNKNKFKINKNEVKQIKWFSKKEIEKLIKTKKSMFVIGFKKIWNSFY